MSVKSDLEKALKEAMRAGDDVRKGTLRLALSAIKLAEVDAGGELQDADVLGILQKEVKSRREAMEEAERAGRTDLVEAAEAEIAVLEEFLPQPLADEELEALVKSVIAEVGAQSPGDMGRVMKAIMPRVQGRADGGKVNQMVRQHLQSN